MLTLAVSLDFLELALMASTWVYLARHGEVLHAAEGRFFGHTDIALSPVGVAQVAALGESLSDGADRGGLCERPAARAAVSAAPLAAARGTSVVAVPPLREMAMGRWEGLTFAEIRAREPELCDAVARRSLRDAVPGGRGPGRAPAHAPCPPSGASSSGTRAGASPSSPTEGPTA